MKEHFRACIAAVPKVELHLHLEGAVRYLTSREMAEAAGVFVEGESEWRRPDFRFAGLGQFLATARSVLGPCLLTAAHYERVAYEMFLDLAEQNVVYAEVSVEPTPPGSSPSFEHVLGAVCRGRDRAVSERPIRVGIIVGMGRAHPVEFAQAAVECAIRMQGHGIVGIDLHGDEAAARPRRFATVFETARDAGFGLRAHAGEGAGPSSVWEAIQDLGVTRIAHGTRAVEDAELVEYLRTHPITLDMCPTSNYKLKLVPCLAQHPIRTFFDQGIAVTVSSDDPLFFNTSVSDELAVLHEHLDFDLEQIRQLTVNAVEASFISDDAKAQLRLDVDIGFAAACARQAPGAG
jgi:adenosine deaminase